MVAWLGATYGRRVLRYWNHYLAQWTVPILLVFFSLLVAAIGLGVWQYRRMRRQLADPRAGGAKNPGPEAAAQAL